MKKILNYTFILLVSLIGIIGCSSDEDAAGEVVNPKPDSTTTPTKDDSKAVLSINKEGLVYADVENGSESEMTFVVSNKGNATLKITSVKLIGTGKGDFKTKEKAQNIEASKNATFKVKFAPISIGPKTAELELVTNAGTKKISLTGKSITPVPGVPQFKSQGNLNFGDVDVLIPKTMSYIINNPGNAVLEINNVTFIEYGETISPFTMKPSNTKFSIPAGGSKELKFTFTPRGVRNAPGSLDFYTNIGKKGFSIRGNGIRKSGPIFKADRKLYNFGKLAKGANSIGLYNIAIKNIGTNDLIINTAKLSGANSSMFKLRGTNGIQSHAFAGNVTVQSGKTTYIYIDAEMKTIGVKTATITIDTNDGVHKVDIKLEGFKL